MNYEQAKAALNEGKSVYRAGWPDKTSLLVGDSITSKIEVGGVYAPTEEDVTASDWKIAAPEGRREEPVEVVAEVAPAVTEPETDTVEPVVGEQEAPVEQQDVPAEAAQEETPATAA